MTVQCCKCKKTLHAGEWVAVHGRLADPVSHSYCPDCLLEAHIEIFNAHASSSRPGHARFVAAWISGLTA